MSEVTLVVFEGGLGRLSSVKGCLVFSADRLLSFTCVGLMSLKGAGLSAVIGLWSVSCCGKKVLAVVVVV